MKMYMLNGHKASNLCNILLFFAMWVSYVCPCIYAFFILGHSHPCQIMICPKSLDGNLHKKTKGPPPNRDKGLEVDLIWDSIIIDKYLYNSMNSNFLLEVTSSSADSVSRDN